MTTLVLFASPGQPDAGTTERYLRALAPLGDVALRWIAIPGASSGFRYEASGLRDGQGRVLPRTLAKYAPGVDFDLLAFIGYSAGCWYFRDGLAQHQSDRADLDAALMLDGLHGTTAQLKASATYADARRLFVTHTAVQTHGYPSTTESAQTLRAMTRAATIIPRFPMPGETQKQQHGRALTSHGPEVVASHLVPHLLKLRGELPEEPPPPWRDPALSLGERAVEFSLAEVRRGNMETSGTNSGPRIAAYFAPCERNGAPLGIRSGNWCAAGACFAATESLLPGEVLPHGYRASGIELEQDAKRAGTWTEAPGEVKRGDLCILPRGTPGSWTRHVCRVLQVDGDGLRTVGANEGTSWRVTERRTSDALGFIRYPRPVAADPAIHARAMKRAQQAAERRARVANQPDGMDEVERLIAELGEGLTG